MMPGRGYSAGSSYRYGFNGKEQDPETYGEGNIYDYGFRIYNPRLGKFLSVDPLTNKYPELTPYQFASNMPIIAIDLDGEEAKIVIIYHSSFTGKEFYRTTHNDYSVKGQLQRIVITIHMYSVSTKNGIQWQQFGPAEVSINNPVNFQTGRINLNNSVSNFEKYQNIIFDNEGGYVNDNIDKGGATNLGITIGTFKAHAKKELGIEPTIENLKKITKNQAKIIYRKHYWDVFNGDKFSNGSVAMQIFDWSVTSGGAIKQVELAAASFGIKLKIDGVLTSDEVSSINTLNQKDLFGKIKQYRLNYYQAIVDQSVANYLKAHPNASEKELIQNTQKKFEKGWRKRANKATFTE